MENPINQFKAWWRDALLDSPLQQKSAVCVSTIDERGFPAARFVDLKSVCDQGFVFCTYFDSNKGQQISMNNKAAMTCWWDHVGYQVRIVGHAEAISDKEADNYWAKRSRSAQATTFAFEQSQPLESEERLEIVFEETLLELEDKPIPRPVNWGGYRIRPISIEFLTFRENRLHLRECYQHSDGSWLKQLLQP